jgi:ribonuclease Z
MITGKWYAKTIAFATLALVAFSGNAIAQAIALGPPPPKAPETGLHAILIGTGMPMPNPDRAAASTLVIAGGKMFMVDAGWNSVPRLVENGYPQVDHVLFTHFHLDHYGDLNRVFFNRGGAPGASEPQSIMGPKGTEGFVQQVVESVAIDERYRIEHHGEHWSPNAMQASVKEFDPGVIYDRNGLKITMFQVDHEPIEIAVGYRFDYEGKSIVVSGDTKKSDNLIAASKDCDILIHEAMNATTLNSILPMLRRQNPRGAAMVEDLMEVHTTTIEVAEVAKATNAKKLVLTHLVPSIAPLDAQEKNFIRGMAEIYDGPIIVGRDSMLITAE